MQIERQWRVGQSLAIGTARRLADVMPAGIGRDLVQEQIEPRRFLWIVEVDGVRRHRAYVDRSPHRCARLDQSVVEQITQHSADGTDGKRRAHLRPPGVSRRRYSESEIMGCGRGRRASVPAWSAAGARTSM